MPSRVIVSRELAEFLKVLAHPDRVRLVEELRRGEKDVNSIADALALPATRVSQHLAPLRAHRLVEERREGRQHFYRLTRPGLAGWILGALEFLEVPGPLGDGVHLDRVRELWAAETTEASN